MQPKSNIIKLSKTDHNTKKLVCNDIKYNTKIITVFCLVSQASTTTPEKNGSIWEWQHQQFLLMFHRMRLRTVLTGSVPHFMSLCVGSFSVDVLKDILQDHIVTLMLILYLLETGTLLRGQNYLQVVPHLLHFLLQMWHNPFHVYEPTRYLTVRHGRSHTAPFFP
jgi:hypothetical protein